MRTNSMFARLIAGVFFIQAGAALAAPDFGQCRAMFPTSQAPEVRQPARPLCFDAFAVLYSPATRTPIYVVEKLNRERLLDARDEERTDNFYEEARLPWSERATLRDFSSLRDYLGSRLDRGHMAPAADMPTPEAMAQSFSLANMVPQNPYNNRRVWSQVEKAARKYAMRASGDVYVFTGPVFGRNDNQAGRVRIPDYLYKLMYDPSTGRAWAWWLPNTEDARMGPPISYQELVARTGIEFLPTGIR